MKFLNWALLKKKKIRVNEIPDEFLASKSQNSELERKLNSVTFYYLDNGTKLLSVLNDSDNNALEILNILNSLERVFHINYDNLFIRKRDEKLLGFSYPLISKKSELKVNLKELMNILTDSNDPGGLPYNLTKKDEFNKNGARSILINTIFWYKIFKYLNLQNISVRNLTLDDIICYKDTYLSKYIYIMNVVAKLELLGEDKLQEEIAVVNLCVKYFLNAIQENVYGYDLNCFLETFNENYSLYKKGTLTDLAFFESMNFIDVFYKQFENIKEFSCGHEYDKSFFRCATCNSLDKVLSKKEYEEIFDASNLVLKDDELSVYSHLGTNYLLLNENILTEQKFESIKEYVGLQVSDEVNCNYIYNEKSRFIALGLSVRNNSWNSKFIKVEDVEKSMDSIASDLVNNIEKDSFRNFCAFFDALGYELLELYEAGLALDVKDCFDYKEVLNTFLLINVMSGSYLESTIISMKPSSLKLSENNAYTQVGVSDIVVNILFNLIKAKCNSRLENNELVSDGFDIINLLNLEIVREYKNFLKNEIYDSEKVMECLSDVCEHQENLRYSLTFDESYVISPKIFKSVLEDEFDTTEIKKEFEFRKRAIEDNRGKLRELVSFKNSNENIEVILPEYIVYSSFDDKVSYTGYWIKKKKKVYVTEAFSKENLGKMNNKEVMKMVMTYYHYMNKFPEIQNLPVEFLSYDSTFSKMFIWYKPYKNSRGNCKEFFDETLKGLKSSTIYFSDMLQIIESSSIGNKVEKSLTKIYNSFTNYCDVHKIYYEDTLLRCPICSKYYEFVDIEKIYDKKQVVYETELYKLFQYKTKSLLKIYKFTDEEMSTLANGTKIEDIEKQVLSILKNQVNVKNIQTCTKLVKESSNEKVIGVLVTKNDTNLVSIYDVMNSNDITNFAYIKLLQTLLKSFEHISFAFTNLKINTSIDIENFLKYHLYCNESKKYIWISDYEFLFDFSVNITLGTIRNLDKVIKFILSYDKKCYDLRTIEYPEIDYNYTKNMSVILEDLVNYYANNTSKFCSRHSVYYNEVDGMCPLCMEEMSEVWIKNKNEKGKEVNFGGEGFIYTLGRSSFIKGYKVNKISGSDKNIAAEIQKAFDEEERIKNSRRKQVLEVSQKLYYSTMDELKNKNFIIAFPKKNVYAGPKKNFIGFVQDRVVDPVSFSLFINIEKCKELGFTTSLSLLEILISYGEGVEYLHNSETIRKTTPDGIVVGDVSGRNVLYSKYLKKVAIIDMDSAGIKGAPASTFTDEYSDPLTVDGDSIGKNFSFESDWYSYAIICFYTLTKVHPFDGTYNNSRNMTIIERKEKKISVIGKYKDKITLPKIVVSWDWMPNYLLNAFIDIFENEKRYSILDLLKRAYNELCGAQKYKLDKISEVEVQEDVVKSDIAQKNKKSSINLEILAEVTSNNGFLNHSSNLLVKNGKVYYKNELEKNLLCDDVLNFKELSYSSENDMKKLTSFVYDEVCLRDSDGVATSLEDDAKYIGIVRDEVFVKIYRISDNNRKFKILYDMINNKYLLISKDNSKSYVVFYDKRKVQSYAEVHVKNINSYDIFNDALFESRVSYVGNSIYYTKNGYICRLDLNSGAYVEIKCPLATEKSGVKVFKDAIIIVTSKEILKLKM